MTITVAELDAMPRADAAALLADCCGARAWVEGMLVRRPFGNRAALLRAADDVASALSEPDWLEAFAHHPRIGERTAAADVSPAARRWSEGEQSASGAAGPALRRELAAMNAEYERRFGFVFIICASGRSADAIAGALSDRMGHDRETELGIAAHEQRAITRLRLEKLVPNPEDGGA